MRYELDPADDKTAVRDVPDDLLRALKETTVYDSAELLARAGMMAEQLPVVEEPLDIPIDVIDEEPPRPLHCIPPPRPPRWRPSFLLLLAGELLLTGGVIYVCRWLAAAF